MITKEQIETMLKNAETEIQQYLIKQVKERISQEVQWNLNKEINTVVSAYIRDEIAPDIKAALIDSKPAILEAVAKAANEIGATVTEALVSDAKKNLGNSYSRQKLMEALFK